ncbi:ABC transporter permease [Tenacibaculum sp. nBUS_03]|uniref:ABC transporter permease n=1 Tax=Tenacibaculum sp. nBUS_03 TaxID=3395320 RepID=UPI003EBF7B7E
MFKIWIKIFLRSQKKNWLNTLVNILGVGLSLAILLFVSFYFQEQNSYDQLNPNKEIVYRVLKTNFMGKGTEIGPYNTAIEGDVYKEQIPDVVDTYLSVSNYRSGVIELPIKKHYITKILKGETSFFNFFPFQVVQGSAEEFKKTRQNVAISEKLAKSIFDGGNCIGKTFKLNNRKHIITTVYKLEGKHYFMPNLVIQNESKPEGNWFSLSWSLFIKTKNNSVESTIINRITDIWNGQWKQTAERRGISLDEYMNNDAKHTKIEKLRKIRLYSKSDDGGPEGKGNLEFIYLMVFFAVILLIISSVNFINLSLASASIRAKEIGVRKVIGASKKSIFFGVVFELIAQCLIAFIIALLIIELSLSYFNDYFNTSIEIYNSFSTIIYVFILTIFLALLISFFPAIVISNYKAVKVLKGNISRNKNNRSSKSLMLGIQFLISGFFLILSVVMFLQVKFMLQKDVGFNGDQVMVVNFNTNFNNYKKYLVMKKELTKHPNISKVTSSYMTPGTQLRTNMTNIVLKGVENGGTIMVMLNPLDIEHFDLLNIKLEKGRFLQKDFVKDTISNVLINKTMARKLGIANNPIGKELILNNKTLKIVGVIKDYITSFGIEPTPTLYYHWNIFSETKTYMFNTVQLKVDSNDMTNVINFVKDYWKKNIEDGYPFNYRFVDEDFALSLKNYQNNNTMFFILTILVIFIALIGVFALASLTIQQRLKEVAIRKALGASTKELIYQLVINYIKIAGIALIIILPISYYFVEQWLSDFIYRIEIPVLPFIITPIIIITLTFFVVGIKAFNATKIDLIKYLKFE